MVETNSESTLKTILKYFAHGILFTLLFTGLTVVLGALGTFFLLAGGIIGLIILVVVLIFVIGFANSAIGSYLWDLPVDAAFTSMLIHGFMLFVALVVVDVIVVILPQMYLPGIPTAIVLSIIGCFINGAVGKRMAEIWEIDASKTHVTDTQKPS